MSGEWTIGVIGGSGLYQLDTLEDSQWIDVQSPWGDPSDAIQCGTIGGLKVRFLPRHGRGHAIAPHAINARANIDALKRAGCTDILAVSAVDSLNAELPPGHAVIVDQFLDQTNDRAISFFGNGFVARVSMAEPVCPRLSQMAAVAVNKAGGSASTGATYCALNGPQSATRAEHRLYRRWGADVIGTTAMPEAKLAREAELPYALIGLVTCMYEGEDNTPVADGDTIAQQLHANGVLAQRLAERLISALPDYREESPIDFALEDAVVTRPEYRDPEMLAKLRTVAGRLLGGA